MNKHPPARNTYTLLAISGNRRLLIMLYMMAVFLYWISQYLYIPTLPVYVLSKTDNLALVGVVLAMYGLWQAIIRLPLGIAADWLGWRKPFILACFALSGLGAWILGRVNELNWLIIGRAITGLAAGTWVLLIVEFSSLFPSKETVRAAAILTLVFSFSRMLATGATGFLNELGGYSLAFFLATGAAILAILVVLPIREQRHPSKHPTVQGILKLITRRDVLLPSLLNAVALYVIWGPTYGFLPILVRQFGATDVILSILITMNIAVFTAGTLGTAIIVQRIGIRRLVYLSFILLSVGIGLAALASSLFFTFVVQLFIGLGAGIGYPVLTGMSIEHVADSERATAMGLHQAVYAVGMFTGPWLSGILADMIGIRSMFGVTAFVCFVLGILGTRLLSD